METAVLAGGCFWCTEATLKRLKGVSSVMPGYAGGHLKNPTYQDVSSGTSGHAEAVQVTFDPAIIPYKKLLEIFFHLHDPTTRDRQGNDVGSQYRSAILYEGPKQKREAMEVRKKLDDAHVFRNPIVTEISPLDEFYLAEESHIDYYAKNSYQPYCQYVVDPKLTKLLAEYRADLKEEYQAR